jgi:hypothetical protein
MVAYMSLGTGILVVIAVWAATILSTTFAGTVFHRWITSDKDLDARGLPGCFWVGWCQS